jgi:hypothetical protein
MHHQEDMTSTTLALQARLWRMYGDKAHAAEWDGNVYGGGRLSQRFWEYHKTIDALDLTADSVVLDIGGGSPKTGVSLFVKVLAGVIKRVIVVDASLPPEIPEYPNVLCISKNATQPELEAIFTTHSEITHVTSVSVFEHIAQPERMGIVRGINEHFAGDTFVLTLEFHATTLFFEEQLTTRTLSDIGAALTRFVPVWIEASPFYAENAVRPWRPLYARILVRLGVSRAAREQTPPIGLWKPILLKFVRAPAVVC